MGGAKWINGRQTWFNEIWEFLTRGLDSHGHLPPAGMAATTIALGWAHTCVIVVGGGVKCWGLNDDGQLGVGSTVQQNSPVDVPLGAGNMVTI